MIIGYAHPGWIHEEFNKCLNAFAEYDGRYRRILGGAVRAQGHFIAENRNICVDRFLEHQDEDILLFLDYDVLFSPRDVYTVIDAITPDTPIVCGMYVNHFGKERIKAPCWMEEVDDNPVMPVRELRLGEMHPLTACGMGFTAIHRSVFEKVKANYPNDPWHCFAHDLIKVKGRSCRFGEDVTFCFRAREAGFSIWGHGGILLGHKKYEILTVDDLRKE